MSNIDDATNECIVLLECNRLSVHIEGIPVVVLIEGWKTLGNHAPTLYVHGNANVAF